MSLPTPATPSPPPSRGFSRRTAARMRLVAAWATAPLLLAVSQPPVSAPAAVGASHAESTRVGHRIETTIVPGSFSCPDVVSEPDCAREPRRVDVHLWYPADPRAYADAPETTYTSALHGRPLIPERWDPLSWTVDARIARETPAIDTHGNALPVIVFSHGSVNDPIDYAHTLERIAGEGFVVAAPYHVNNTQDDVRRDFVNERAGFQLLPCLDSRPSPCSRTNVPRSMQDRVRDITKILDTLPAWLGTRVDATHVGVMGHSRGTVTALAAAGGSDQWGFPPERRVGAVMGMAIGAAPITFGANLSRVQAPTLLVAGARDETSPQDVSEAALRQIDSDDKAFVSITNATHRTFDSTYCAQLQAAGAVADTNGDRMIDESELSRWQARAILDWHTLRGIAASPPNGLSGKAVQYCSQTSFTSPVDIGPAVAAIPNSDYPPSPQPCAVPCAGLSTDEVEKLMAELAVAFFGSVLKPDGHDGTHFTRHLAPNWLEHHEPIVGRAEAFAGADAVCPPGQEVDCG